MILSILIPTLKSRKESFSKLWRELFSQIIDMDAVNDVEVISEEDNGKISTGEKRNILLSRARGEYVIFIDDDDWIAEYYIQELLIAAESGADCFAMDGRYFIDGKFQAHWKLSKDYIDHDGPDGILYRRTNHIAAVKRSIANKAKFPNKSNAEDKEYSIRLQPFLKTEYHIAKPMYDYLYSSRNKSYT